ncbi:hypothetical protein ABZP36_028597 [Zizania latifolia]
MRLGHGHKPEEEPKAKAAAPPEEDAMEVDEVCPGVNTNAEELGDEEAVEDEEAVMVVPLVLVVLPLRLLFLLSGLIVNVIQLRRMPIGNEHALVISNHRSDIDWLIGWILAQRLGCLGSTLAVMKKSSKFLPAPRVIENVEGARMIHSIVSKNQNGDLLIGITVSRQAVTNAQSTQAQDC